MAEYGIIAERDVDVPMRDGARLKADVLRPDADGKFPAILNLGPYQKDKLWLPPDTLEESPNPLMNWETINPQWWVPKGYAAVRRNRRASASPGRWRNPSIFMTLSNGPPGKPGAQAKSGSPASPITPSISGSLPTISRHR